MPVIITEGNITKKLRKTAGCWLSAHAAQKGDFNPELIQPLALEINPPRNAYVMGQRDELPNDLEWRRHERQRKNGVREHQLRHHG